MLPAAWKQAKVLARGVSSKPLDLRESLIREAFNQLVTNKRGPYSRCFCFFIDGLDEYQATAQYDYKDVVQLLCRWTDASPQNIKLCVSSREYNVFMDAFSPSQRLRLHELTMHDFTTYVKDRLNGWDDESHQITLLTKSIVEKANGIFLWVSLVVSEIREQLVDGAGSDLLFAILHDLPMELGALYRHILESLSERNRRKVYQTFAILCIETKRERDMDFSLLQYSFFDAYCKDPEFAQHPDFETLHSGADIKKREMEARKRLNGCCRGLVDADEWGTLDFAHRSVSEFLQQPAIKDQMAAHTNGFHAVDAFSQLILAEIRVTSWLEIQVSDLMRMRDMHDLDQPPFAFLRCLEAARSQEIWDRVDNRATSYGPIVILSISICDIAIGQPMPEHTCEPSRLVEISLPTYQFPGLKSPAYTLWRITNDSETTDTTSKAVLLAYLALWNRDDKPTYPVLDVLLDRGIITPDTRTRLMPYHFSFNYSPVHLETNAQDGLSFWQLYLITTMHKWLSRSAVCLDAATSPFAGTTSRLLRHGANPCFRFSIKILVDPDGPDEPDAPDTPLVVQEHFSFGDPGCCPETVSLRRRWIRGRLCDDEYARIRNTAARCADGGGEISLQDWIRDFMGDFEGKPDLLRLVQEKLEERACS